MIDELRIYNRALNAAEVAAIANEVLIEPSSPSIPVASVSARSSGVASAVTATVNTPYVFGVNDFNFRDTEGDVLVSITIQSLATVGDLKLDGIEVAAGQTISRSDIDAGLLTFAPPHGEFGAHRNSFTFTVNNLLGSGAFEATLTVDVV